MLLLSEYQMSKACKPSTKHCCFGGQKRCKVQYFRFGLQRFLFCADDKIVTYASYDYSQTACPFILWHDDSIFIYVDVFVLTVSQGTGSLKKNFDGLDIVTGNINIKWGI